MADPTSPVDLPPPSAGTPAGTPADAGRGTARPHTAVVGGDALRTATGRSREEWFALLDAEGAVTWPHAAVAGWLSRVHAVDAWWAQGLTVGYEQARGIRVPGQRRDGSFETSVSRTLRADPDRVWRLVSDPELRARWLDVPVVVTGETVPASARWTLPDGTRVVARLAPVRPGATRVTAQHRRLPDAAAAAAARADWSDRLARLAGLAAGP